MKKKTETLGEYLRRARLNNNHSIKSLAPILNINYSYLSKIENDHTLPSEDLLNKIAELFNLDREELLVRAGKIPEDITKIIQDNPKEAVAFLRRAFSE